MKETKESNMEDFIKILGITKIVNGDVRWPNGPVCKIPTTGNPITDVLVGVVVESVIDRVCDWFTD
jgi:hypothetical protein